MNMKPLIANFVKILLVLVTLQGNVVFAQTSSAKRLIGKYALCRNCNIENLEQLYSELVSYGDVVGVGLFEDPLQRHGEMDFTRVGFEFVASDPGEPWEVEIFGSLSKNVFPVQGGLLLSEGIHVYRASDPGEPWEVEIFQRFGDSQGTDSYVHGYSSYPIHLASDPGEPWEVEIFQKSDSPPTIDLRDTPLKKIFASDPGEPWEVEIFNFVGTGYSNESLN